MNNSISIAIHYLSTLDRKYKWVLTQRNILLGHATLVHIKNRHRLSNKQTNNYMTYVMIALTLHFFQKFTHNVFHWHILNNYSCLQTCRTLSFSCNKWWNNDEHTWTYQTHGGILTLICLNMLKCEQHLTKTRESHLY